MDNKFLQSVNLDLLQMELEKDIQGIADMLGVSAQTVYKWSRDKEKGGCRPTYDAIYSMFLNGASTKSLFGIESLKEKAKPLNQEDFLDGVRQALAALAKSSPDASK